jgi:hypothetical protein
MNNGMAGIVAASGTAAKRSLLRKHIRNLSLSFITPLTTENDCDTHDDCATVRLFQI